MSSKDDYLRNGGPVFEINPAEIDKNPDGLKPDNTDLKRTTKKTLKDYLSDKTSINQFPVDKRHDENKPDTTIYGDSEGKTSPELKINDPDVNEHQYKPQFLQKERVVSRFNPGKLRDTNLDGGINGNNLLNDWDYTQTASDKRTNKPVKEVVDYTNRKLSANRFSDNNEYGSNIGDKTFSIKKRKSNSPNSEKRIDLSVDQLNEIASYLMLKASGKDAKPGESSMFVPGIQQLIPGTKLNGNGLNINQIVKDLYVNEEDKDILGQDSGQYRNSFGVLNNYFDRFEKTSVGTLALSASLVGATIAALLVAAGLYALLIQEREIELDYLSSKEELPEDRKNYKKPSDIIPTFEYITGIQSSRFKAGGTFWSRFADFYLDLMKGGQIFFSLNGNALALLGSFGYYSNFCRSITRDTFRIIDLFTPKKGESDLEYADNMVSYDTLQIVKNSKLTKCMNLFIKLSDLQKDTENKNRQSLDILKLKLSSINTDEVINEDNINNDGVPFYFKDLRNDKIIQFYATLSEFSETYSPQWVEEQYYGRVDPIKFYKSTTRKVSLNFKVFSYSEVDHKVMWDKLQDLTSLVYPTYTNKRVIQMSDKSIEVPFSQTFKSQPLIRVKLGDLITNNIGDVTNFIKEDSKKKDFNFDKVEEIFDDKKSEEYSGNAINEKREDFVRKLRIQLSTKIGSKNGEYPELLLNITNDVLGKDVKYLLEKGCFSGVVYTELYDDPKYGRSIYTGIGNLETEKPVKKIAPNKIKKVLKQNKTKKDSLVSGMEAATSKTEIVIKTSENLNISDLDQEWNSIFDLRDKNVTDINEIFLVSHKGSKNSDLILIKSPTLVDMIKKEYKDNTINQESEIDKYFVNIKYVGIKISHLKPKLLETNPTNTDKENNPFYKAMERVYGLGALAYVDNLSYKTLDGYQWEIKKELGRRPKIIDVSMELTILHDIQPFSTKDYKHRQGGI